MAKNSGGGAGTGGRGGSGSSSDRVTPMTREAASRIQSTNDKRPASDTARSGFGPRAQSAAAHNEADPDDDSDDVA